jgi:hypothetical protein
MMMHLRPAIEGLKMQMKLAEIRHRISDFNPSQTYGSNELAEIIQEINSISPFLELSRNELKNLIDLTFKVSLKKEESRYPRFQIYIPASGFELEELNFLVEFDPPIALSVSTLHRISPGIPSRPYALLLWKSESEALLSFWWKWYLATQKSQSLNGENLDLWWISLAYHLISGRAESEETFHAYGLIRVEAFGIHFDSLKLINSHTNSGLILSIEEPGALNVFLFKSTPERIIANLNLRHGKIELTYTSKARLIDNYVYADIEEKILERNKRLNSSSKRIFWHIRNVWSYILSLAVDFGHGGQFIILPPDISLNKKLWQIKDTEVLQVEHTATRLDLGAKIATFDCYSDQIQQILLKNDFNSRFKDGLDIAEIIQDEYQSLFDSARAIANLSTADGSIVFDRGLRLLGFKGEVLVKETPGLCRTGS